MRIFQKLVLIVSASTLLFSCSNLQSSESLNENDILKADNEKYKIQTSSEYSYLTSSSEIADSTTPFTQVKAFIPSESYSQELLVQDEPFIYLKVPSDTSIIAGEVVYENATEQPMKVRSLFLQGNSIAKVRLTNSKEWKSSAEYEVKANSSVSLEVEISWENTGMQELTFFPLDQTSDPSRYEGGSLSTYRFYVQSKDTTISDDLMKKQSNNLTLTDINDIDFFPVPSWLGKSKEPVEYNIVDDQLIIKDSLEFLELASVPYNTSVDILMIDEFGNVDVLKENISILKNVKTLIEISKLNIEESPGNRGRRFLLVTNNREEILADLKTLDLRKKLFSTSYQGLIEVFPFEGR